MWWNHVPVRRELTVPRDGDWNPKIERQWQMYIGKGNYGPDWTVLLKHKKNQDRKRIRVERLEEKVDTMIEAYFGCYSKLLGVESEYPRGPIALNLEMESGYIYPAIIPASDSRSIEHLFEKYRIKRVDDLNGKHILVYHSDIVLRAVRVPKDYFLLWTDPMVEIHEDALSRQLSEM